VHKCFHINKANYLYIDTYVQMISHKQIKLFVYRNVCHKRFHINKADYLYIDTYAQMLSHKQSKLFVYIYVCTNGFT